MKKSALFVLAVATGFLSFGQNSAIISGRFSNFKRDSIKCALLLNDVIRKTQIINVPVQNGVFKQQLAINNSTYLYLTDGENYFNGLIEPGDSIVVNFDTLNVSQPLYFSGRGSEKFQFLFSFLQAKVYKKIVTQIPIAKSKKNPFDHMFNYLDSTEKSFINQLNSLKKVMSQESYSLLLGDITGSFLSNRNRSVGMIYHENIEETLKNRENELTPQSKITLESLMNFDNKFSYSKTYINEVYNILFTNYDYLTVTNKMANDLKSKYQYLNNLLPSGLRVPVLTLFLEYDIKKLNQGEELELLIQNTYQFKDSLYKEYISSVYKRVLEIANFKKGVAAPGFLVENENGEQVSLSSFKGKVVYIDFWYAACGPCHALFETIKPVKNYFSSKDVVFLTISIDTKEVWKRALEKYNIKGYHVFTQDQESNHPVVKAYKVSGYPTTCLIDKKGNVYNANPSNMPDELQKQIAEALKVE